MKKYTANYANTNSNFVIQNLPEGECDPDLLPTIYVLKNILQRGCPTLMSKYLQEQIGNIQDLANFNERFYFISKEIPVWHHTILGDEDNDYNPAKQFIEAILPEELGENKFISSLFLPEVEINQIVGNEKKEFALQRVDFYSPELHLVIEIDGKQHEEIHKAKLDRQRDSCLKNSGKVTIIRITTENIRNGYYKKNIAEILTHCQQIKKFEEYRKYYDKIVSSEISEEEIRTKFLPCAVIRFQILLLELLECGKLNFEQNWNINILNDEGIGDFAKLAIDDLIIWLKKLWRLRKKEELLIPQQNITYYTNPDEFEINKNNINIDFSLLKRFTDEMNTQKQIIFVRTDYFDFENERDSEAISSIRFNRNYFHISTTDSICYNITKEDEDLLNFFLNNIFGKETFRPGQFPIIANTLNLRDTIGLLPTGSGKSLCYQLSCILQPSVNFVVCPIKSLMYDQKDNLEDIYISNTNYISSDLNAEQRGYVESNFKNGKYLIIWISPERFQIPSFREVIEFIIYNFTITYAVIDEVHCLSEWGHDFRTSYLNLISSIDKLSKKDSNGDSTTKLIGLTATASLGVLKDIKIEFSKNYRKFDDNDVISLINYGREELYFEVIQSGHDKFKILKEKIDYLKSQEDFLVSDAKAGLIFTPHVNGPYGCYKLATDLNKIYNGQVSWFSGAMPRIKKQPVMSSVEFDDHKQRVQKDFKSNKYRLLVATKAFGMGIDKSNIYYTFHYGLPSSVESLYQEAGRAGRWSKNDPSFTNKKAKCYIIHTQEIDYEKIDRSFEKGTSIKIIDSLIKETDYCGEDVNRILFLFLQNHHDINDDLYFIQQIITRYYNESNLKKNIYWDDAFKNLNLKADRLEKIIYRLSLLGIITDWTVSYKYKYYTVEFKKIDIDYTINCIENYINRYDVNIDVKNGIYDSPGESLLDKCIYYLLSWIFNEIIYQRKQALKYVSEICRNFTDSDSFKKALEDRFTFTDDTYTLQHIVENPNDYQKWFNLKIFKELNRDNLTELKARISRFLESYRNSTGLNFISGFTRLLLDEFENTDGRSRFESSLFDIEHNIIFKHSKEELYQKIVSLGDVMTIEQQEEFGSVLASTNAVQGELFANRYGLDTILVDSYRDKVAKLKMLNRRLYGQLGTI